MRVDGTAPVEPMDTLTIFLAGDVMTGRGIDQVLQRPSAPALFEPHVRDARDYVRLAERVSGPIARGADAAYPWGDALAALARASPQARIVNLETAVTTAEAAWPGKDVHYRMHPGNVGCLQAGAIDCCALANNHVLDWGAPGLAETLRTLRAAGLRCAGAGADGAAAWAPAVLPLPAGRRLVVFACALASSGVPAGWAAGPQHPGIALLPDLSEATAQRLAAAAAGQRRAGDVLMLSIHWGANWVARVPAEHRRFAHRLVDLGAADIVHGHSSHHPLPIEVYRGRPILYGCGDLINDYEGIAPPDALRGDLGCLYFATLDAAHGHLLALEIVPMQRRRLRLQHADAAARQALEWLLSRGECGTWAVPLHGRRDGSLALQWGRP